MDTKLKIIVADDHPLFREGIASTLSRTGCFRKIQHAADGEEVISLLADEPADVVLMDIRMKKMNGMEATIIISKKFPSVKVIALSMFDDRITIAQMLECGAMGFITKEAGKDELMDAIKTVLNDEYYFSPSLLDSAKKILKEKMHPENGKAVSHYPSALQMIILKKIISGKTSKVIADELSITVDDIKYHRSQLLAKFGAANVAELIAKVSKTSFIED